MKKIFAFLTAAVLCLALAACGAGSPPDATPLTIDTAALSADLQSKVTYPDELYPLDASMVNTLLSPDSVPEGTESIVYMNAVSYVRFAIFTCGNETDAAGFKTTLEGFVERQVKADYDPAEATLLENVILTQKGPYVVMCVTADTENAQSIIDGYMK